MSCQIKTLTFDPNQKIEKISSYQFQLAKLLHKHKKGSSPAQQRLYSCRRIFETGFLSALCKERGSFLTIVDCGIFSTCQIS